MAAVSKRSNAFLSRFKPLLSLKTFYSKFATVGKKRRSHGDKDYDMEGEIKISKWKKMDSRVLGITPTMVPLPPYLVLKILKSRGFEAYLVGGCVRDLLLKRTPKDFDVITTADLNQIRKQFHRCVVVGRRFPVCRVHIKDSVIEVSSFKTLAKHSEGKEKFLVSQMPRGCDKTDLNLWKNSMHRDFTINSLFFDPLAHRIYDYTEGMKDLLDLKLRTLVPAHLSFTEDCARILRGLRIAARLGLSFSKDVEIAINKHASSILDLSKERLMMELNYMLSFGAAESSLSLLHRFHLLEALLPFQAAYISQQATRSDQSSTMLMKLFFHLDKLVTCDQPSDCRLWIGLLAFHTAIVNNPQDPLVVLAFASVLYHQKWEKGLQFARQHGQAPISFEPEISGSYDCISDDELAKKVNQLANLAVASIDVLVDRDDLHETMANFPGFPFSDLVFISNKYGHGAAQIFHVLTHKLKTYKKGRTSFEVDLDLLGKGDSAETRFALGKIILNTIGCEVDQDCETIKDDYHSPSSFENGYDVEKKEDKRQPRSPFNSELQEGSAHKRQMLIANVTSTTKRSKKQNGAKDLLNVITDGNLLEQEESEEVTSEKHAKVLSTSDQEKQENAIEKPEEIRESQSSMKNLICLLETVIGDEKEEDKLMEDTDPESDQLVAEEQRVKRKSRMKTKILENSIGNEKSPFQLESEKQEDKLVKDTNLEANQLIAEEKRVKRKRRRKTKSLEISIGNEKSPSQLESEKQEDKLVVDTKLEADLLIAKEQIIERKRKRISTYLGTLMGNKTSPSQLDSQKPEDELVEDTQQEADRLTAHKQSVKGKGKKKLEPPLSVLFK